MAVCRRTRFSILFILCFLPSTVAYLEGLYCGLDNCYEGKTFIVNSLNWMYEIVKINAKHEIISDTAMFCR